MAKKSEVAVSANVRTDKNQVAEIGFGDAERALAEELRVNLSASVDSRAGKAVFSYNVATENLLVSGLLLASIKAEVSHEEFVSLVSDRGLHIRRAYELMRGANFVASLTPEQRAEVMTLEKTKIMALGSADPQVVEAMLDDGEIDIHDMSVRAMRERIRELEAAAVDKDAAKQAAEAERDAALKKLDKSRTDDRDDVVPAVFADIRAEVVALQQKVQLCLDSYRALGVDLAGLAGVEGGQQWGPATVNAAVGALFGIHLGVRSLIEQYVESFELDPANLVVELDPAYGLSRHELVAHALNFEDFKQQHNYEVALREWDREQSRPQGKGRPKNKPEAPKGKKA